MFLYFNDIKFFLGLLHRRRLTPRCVDNTDVGAHRPAGSSPI
jgi:hypothetical protein